MVQAIARPARAATPATVSTPTCAHGNHSLTAPGGAVLAELDPPGAWSGVTRVRLEAPGAVSEWFPWAHVSVDTVTEVAAEAGLVPDWTMRSGARWFTALRRP